MGKWIEPTVLRRNTNKYMKNCSFILTHKANQNYTEIPAHPSHMDSHQENKQ
jgi:hypothetical protein